MEQNKDNEISSSIMDNCFNCGDKDRGMTFCMECNYNPYEKIQDVLSEFYNENKSRKQIYNKSEIIKLKNKHISSSNWGWLMDCEINENDIFFGINLTNGLKIIFYNTPKFNIPTGISKPTSNYFELKTLLDIYYKTETLWFKQKEVLYIKNNENIRDLVSEDDKELLNKLIEKIKLYFINLKNSQKIIVDEKLTQLNESKSLLLDELDKDGNGQIDVVEGNDFNLLLKNHQKQIIEFGRNDNKNYVQQFIQLKNYLNTQKKNVQHVFDSIKDISNQTLLDEYVKVLKNNIHSYEVLLVHSLNMISVLVEDDLFTFYDIYEKLDKLNIFNSNYQNEMLDRLSEIEDRLEEIIYSIEDMSISIVSGLDSLTEEIGYSTKLLSENLNSIESSIDLNSLITGIGSYQMYKINKNIKSLN
jgi:hypothetical protein